MTTLDIAHIHEQGQDIIIALMDRSFGNEGHTSQIRQKQEIQFRCVQAGLRGIVFPAWQTHNGSMSFMAPNAWHPYFNSITPEYIYANLNRRLSW